MLRYMSLLEGFYAFLYFFQSVSFSCFMSYTERKFPLVQHQWEWSASSLGGGICRERYRIQSLSLPVPRAVLAGLPLWLLLRRGQVWLLPRDANSYCRSWRESASNSA